jgi:glycosyltransferase involved in cell wall biosynthesis
VNELPRIAIAIPAYNAEATLPETLDSIQRCRGIDAVAGVVICDDDSGDATVSCASASWRAAVPLTVLHNIVNLGERATVNKMFGYLRNRCDWVLIVHADDRVKDNWLELYFERLRRAASTLASVCSSYDCWNPENRKIIRGEDDPERNIELIRGGREAVMGTLRRGCWWHISGCAIHLENFFEIGEFRTDLPQLGDYEWLLRCLRCGYDIEYIPRTTCLYRLHARSVSSASFADGRDLRESLQIFSNYFSDGYLSKQEWWRIRVRMIFGASRRALKRGTRLQFGSVRQLLSVCRDAAAP